MIQRRNKVILTEMYNKVQEELKASEEYKQVQNKFEEERKKFLTNIEEQNSETLERLTDILNDMYEEQEKQFFNKAFEIATELFLELASKE